MITLADMQFEELRPGMKFQHPDHGEQIVLDLGWGQLGRTIKFHNCHMYSGEIPQLEEDADEVSIFEVIAQNTFPYGAENWEYLGMATREEIVACGLEWFQVECPHCGYQHRLLCKDQPSGQRQCRQCGMVFSRPAQSINS